MKAKQSANSSKVGKISNGPAKKSPKSSKTRRPKKGGTISLKTAAIVMTVFFELFRIGERNSEAVKDLLQTLQSAPDQVFSKFLAILTSLDQPTIDRLRLELRSSANAAIKVTSHLFVFDEYLQQLTPSAVISLFYLVLRDFLYKKLKPKPSENDQLFEWVYAIALCFPLVREQFEFLSNQGEQKVQEWKDAQRQIALYEFRKRLSQQRRIKRIEEDLSGYLGNLFPENLASE